MKINITIDLDEVLKKPVTEWTKEDEDGLEDVKSKLPLKEKEVVLTQDESQVEPPETKPVIHTVKTGDTLKKIAEKYSVSFGELSNYMMSKNGSTAITPGMEIEIPRHFIDLSQA